MELRRIDRIGRRARIVAVATGLLAAGILALGASDLPRQQREASRWVVHTLEVLGALSQVQAKLVMVVSEGRGFIIQANAESRARVDAAVVQLNREFAGLRALTADNLRQQDGLDRLQPLLLARVALTQGIMDQLAAGDVQGAMDAVRSHRGRAIMDRVYAATTAIEAEERRLLDIRQKAFQAAVRRITGALVGCGIIIALSGISQVAVLRRRVGGRRHVAALSRQNAELEARVATRTAELAASVVRQRGYFDNSPIAMVVSRVAEGRFVLEDINPAGEAIYGFSRASMLGRPLGDIWPESVTSCAEPYLLACAAGRTMIQYTVEAERGGQQRRLEVQLTPLLDQAGEARDILACVRDLTDQRRLERQVAFHAEQQRAAERQAAAAAERRRTEAGTEQMRRQGELEAANIRLDRLARHLSLARDQADQASMAKSQFVASMSHELRTPLNGILGYAQLLRLEGGLNPAQALRIDAMLRSGQHLLELVNNVLDVSQIEAGRIEVRIARIDAVEVCRACLELVRPTAIEKGLRLEFLAEESLPLVLADPIRLRQVVVNLLGNAAKFTPTGAVTLRVTQARAGSGPPMLCFEVADTGPGVPAAKRDRLFQLFQRLDAADSPLEGAGLGLAISRRLVDLMEGRIGFANNLSGGSVFWFELPAADGGPASRQPAPVMPDPAAPMAALRVLVVDDVAMNRDVVSALLRVGGHQTVCVGSGEAALDLAASDDFDVVLMDVRMPGMGGLEATRRIRAITGERGRVPIVALTAHAFLDQVEDCRHAGMDAHVVKPFDHVTLLKAVQLAGRRARERLPAAREPGAQPKPPASCHDGGESGPDRAALVLDRTIFDRIAALLEADETLACLRTLEARGAEMLGLLRSDAGPQAELAEAAHTMAGSAGMFGFLQVAGLARDLERALGVAAADWPRAAQALEPAIEAMQGLIARQLHVPQSTLGELP